MSVTHRIAVAGCGVVGSALLRLIHEQQDIIAAAHGIRLEPVAVLVRNVAAARDVPPSSALYTDDPAALLTARPDIIVEATGDVDLGRHLAAAAVLRGVPFITASKALVAAHGHELHRAASAAGTYIGFEAAVGGGVPVIRALAESLPHAGIAGFRGVLNGTTNFVLDRLAAGLTLDDALGEARRLGFAEADASRDLDGRDAADKLAILAWLAFGVPPSRVAVARAGIEHRPEQLVRTAAAAGCKVRLLAEAVDAGGTVVASVQPVAVPHDSPFAAVSGADNLLLVATRHGGVLRFAGPGAGGGPTAVSLLGDILHPVRIAVAPQPAFHASGASPTGQPGGQWLLSVDGPSPRLRSAIADATARVGATVRAVDGDDDVVFRLFSASDAAARFVRRAVEASAVSAVLLRADAPTALPTTTPACTTQGTAATRAPTFAPAALHR